MPFGGASPHDNKLKTTINKHEQEEQGKFKTSVGLRKKTNNLFRKTGLAKNSWKGSCSGTPPVYVCLQSCSSASIPPFFSLLLLNFAFVVSLRFGDQPQLQHVVVSHQ